MSTVVPVARLRELCDPLADPPWLDRGGACPPILASEIASAIAEGRLVPDPYSGGAGLGWARGDHVARIAWLAVHGWDEPLEVDVGVPDLEPFDDALWGPRWVVYDGNHRLAAAIYRGDLEISVSIAGDVDFATDLFGVECAEEEAA